MREESTGLAEGLPRSDVEWLERLAACFPSDELESAAVPADRAERLRGDRAAFEFWRRLLSGRSSLVAHFGRQQWRYVVTRRSDPEIGSTRALSLRERQVTWGAVLGQANKLIASQLGLSLSTVATHLARAASKLGVRSRAELIGLLSPVVDPTFEFWGSRVIIAPEVARQPRVVTLQIGDNELAILTYSAASAPLGRLTATERDLLQGLLRGHKLAALAVERGRSLATVRHQVEMIYSKLGVHSRAELVALCSK